VEILSSLDGSDDVESVVLKNDMIKAHGKCIDNNYLKHQPFHYYSEPLILVANQYITLFSTFGLGSTISTPYFVISTPMVRK
jgi:hypothetical protein